MIPQPFLQPCTTMANKTETGVKTAHLVEEAGFQSTVS